ncbi:MAG TPA: hypothetical protein VF079_01155 [Sphingomicrobium sp.]
MWELAAVALSAATPADNDRATFEREEFGARMTLTCTWFTNFENSRFEQCLDRTGNIFGTDERASIKCRPGICEAMDAEARKVAHWRKPEPPWGTFTVKLIGRVGIRSHQPQYLGDGTRTLLIERLLRVRKAR